MPCAPPVCMGQGVSVHLALHSGARTPMGVCTLLPVPLLSAPGSILLVSPVLLSYPPLGTARHLPVPGGCYCGVGVIWSTLGSSTPSLVPWRAAGTQRCWLWCTGPLPALACGGTRGSAAPGPAQSVGNPPAGHKGLGCSGGTRRGDTCSSPQGKRQRQGEIRHRGRAAGHSSHLCSCSS